jgi:hypothetical protein
VPSVLKSPAIVYRKDSEKGYTPPARDFKNPNSNYYIHIEAVEIRKRPGYSSAKRRALKRNILYKRNELRFSDRIREGRGTDSRAVGGHDFPCSCKAEIEVTEFIEHVVILIYPFGRDEVE